MLSAAYTAVSKALHGVKSTAEYTKTPILEKSLEKAIKGAERYEKEEKEKLMEQLIATLDTMGTNFNISKGNKAAE